MNATMNTRTVLKESWSYFTEAVRGKTNLVQRIKAILTKPREEWEIIERESTGVNQIFSGYAFVLILIPALGEFIRLAVFHGSIRAGIAGFINYLLLNTIVVFGLAKVSEWLAPSLYSESDYRKSLQLVAYSLTPFWLAGVTNLFFSRRLYILFLAWFYCAYILKKGLPLLKKTPADKVVGYFSLVIIAMIFGTFLVSSLLGIFF